MKYSKKAITCIFLLISQTKAAESALPCDNNLNWADVGSTKIVFAPKAIEIEISRYADGIFIKKTRGEMTSKYINLENGKTIVKPPDINPLTSFLEIDQVAGIPIQILAAKFAKPCDVSEKPMPITGLVDAKNTSYDGNVERKANDIQFNLSIYNAQAPQQKMSIDGIVHFDKNLKQIDKSFSIGGWGLAKTPIIFPAETTLRQISENK